MMIGCASCRVTSKFTFWQKGMVPSSTNSLPTGSRGLAPDPDPGLPPELSLIFAPLMVTPEGSILMKLPPALMVNSVPASMTVLNRI